MPFLPLLLANWKYAAMALAILFAFGAGYHTKSTFVAAEQAKVQAAAVAEYITSTKHNADLAAAYEAGKQKATVEAKNIHSNLKASREKNHTADCALSIDELQSLNE